METEELFSWINDVLIEIWASDYAWKNFKDNTVDLLALPNYISSQLFVSFAFADSDPIFADTKKVNVYTPHTLFFAKYPTMALTWESLSMTDLQKRKSNLKEQYSLVNPHPSIPTTYKNINIKSIDYNEILSMVLSMDWLTGNIDPKDFQIETALKFLACYNLEPEPWKIYYEVQGKNLYSWIEQHFIKNKH